MSSEPNPAGKVFDAAKAIVETLQGMEKVQQQQAIRFASESLGLGSSAAQPYFGALPSQPTATSPAASAPTSTRPADIKQFTAAKSPKSDQQFAAVVAYYYRFEAPERKEAIGADDLMEAARLAARERPANAIFTLNNAKAAGYLDSVGRGQFRISTVGENLVAVTLPGDGVGESAGTRPRVQRKKKVNRRKPKKATK